jgi:hypothetical protein
MSVRQYGERVDVVEKVGEERENWHKPFREVGWASCRRRFVCLFVRALTLEVVGWKFVSRIGTLLPRMDVCHFRSSRLHTCKL